MTISFGRITLYDAEEEMADLAQFSAALRLTLGTLDPFKVKDVGGC